MPPFNKQLAVLARRLEQRREAIVAAWRRKISADPGLTTGASLPRAQLHDHLPALLENFERRLRALVGDGRVDSLSDRKADAAAHGLHRWQQGFDLTEVTRELGLLNRCVVAELDRCAAEDESLKSETMEQAREIWASQYGIDVSASVTQYFKLQQLESAGHVSELQAALASLREIELQQAELWHQVAHDLRGNVGVVAMATAGLTSTQASKAMRDKFAGSLDRNVRLLNRLLEDITALARLQGGQEARATSQIDASRLLRELAEAMQPLADSRGLRLSLEGPDELRVEGDPAKIGRIVQNLVLNALKYTPEGEVFVGWNLIGDSDPGRWYVQVRDTGPGLHGAQPVALAAELEKATGQAKEVVAADASGEVAHANRHRSDMPASDAEDVRHAAAAPGEGIGLSIVKRLCGLLDATLEVDSKPGRGTSFRVLLPWRYGE